MLAVDKEFLFSKTAQKLQIYKFYLVSSKKSVYRIPLLTLFTLYKVEFFLQQQNVQFV